MARAQPVATSGGNDERLLIESAKRDPSRFGELYEHNFERVYSYVVGRVRDRSEAQDLTAAVFHQALANLAKFEWRGVPFAAWLYRIASNTIVDRAQRTSREESIDPETPDDTDLEGVEQRAQIFRMVEDLPEDQAKVVRMRFVEGHSVREIAKDLGRSEGAVKQLQFRALQSLRDRLGDHHG
jgi:RNA polymerase sigma-70 factor (ECF subfamily)